MRKAIDIVLIPPDDILKYCIKLNRAIKAKDLRLGMKDRVPHITLLMGGAEEKDLEKIWKITKKVVSKFEPLDLEINAVITDSIKGLEIKMTKELSSLHKQLIKEVSPLLKYDNKLNSFFGKDISKNSLKWVNGYKGKYHPHITIGDGNFKKEDVELPISFKASKIAFYHLGSHCTCRKVFFQTKLK